MKEYEKRENEAAEEHKSALVYSDDFQWVAGELAFPVFNHVCYARTDDARYQKPYEKISKIFPVCLISFFLAICFYISVRDFASFSGQGIKFH